MNKNIITLENFGINVMLNTKLLLYQRDFYEALLNLISKKDLSKNLFSFDDKTLRELLPESKKLDKELLILKNSNFCFFQIGNDNVYLSFDLLTAFEIQKNNIIIEIPTIIVKTLKDPNYNRSVDLIICKKLKTNYAVYLYDYITQHLETEKFNIEFEFDIETFKEIMFIKNKYTVYSGLKAKVIKPTLKELKQVFKTIKFEEIFNKNKVIGVKIKIDN